MMNRRFPTLLGLGLAATLATTTAAAWADAPQTGTPASPHGHHRFQERLGLTDQQVAAIKEVNARHSGERKQLGQSLRDARKRAPADQSGQSSAPTDTPTLATVPAE